MNRKLPDTSIEVYKALTPEKLRGDYTKIVPIDFIFGKYGITPNGEVVNIKKNRTMVLKKTRDGYPIFCFQKEGVWKSLRVHRLVAEAFILNPENKPQVNHKNGIKTDNRVENLEWCTNKENSVHAYANGLKKDFIGEEMPWAKLSGKEALEIFNSKLSYKDLAKKYNISIVSHTLRSVIVGRI